MTTNLFSNLIKPFVRGVLLGGGILAGLSFWNIEQADADSFVIPYAQPQILLDLEDVGIEEIDLLRDFSEQSDPEVIAFLAETIVAFESADWPGGYRGEFLQDVAPAALISAHEYQIPPSIIIGQAIFESGWGRSNLAANFNNLFGIKGSGDNTVKIRTFERNSRNRRYGKWAKFRVFEDRKEAIFYHGRLLAKDRRYAAARANRHDWHTFMEKASKYYASDPNYTKKLAVIIEGYQLDRWDRLIAFLDVERNDLARK